MLDEWNSRRSRIAARYTQELAGTGLALHAVPGWADPVWHLYVVQWPHRDALQQRLTAAGVTTLIHYPISPHRQAAYADGAFRAGELAIAERLASEVLSLPIGPQMTTEQVDAVIRAVKSSTAS